MKIKEDTYLKEITQNAAQLFISLRSVYYFLPLTCMCFLPLEEFYLSAFQAYPFFAFQIASNHFQQPSLLRPDSLSSLFLCS